MFNLNYIAVCNKTSIFKKINVSNQSGLIETTIDKPDIESIRKKLNDESISEMIYYPGDNNIIITRSTERLEIYERLSQKIIDNKKNKKNAQVFAGVSEFRLGDFINDKHIIMLAIDAGMQLYENDYIPKKLRDDYDVIHKLITRRNYVAPCMISDRLKNDEELMFIMFSENVWYSRIFDNLPINIKSNKKFVLKLLKKWSGQIDIHKYTTKGENIIDCLSDNLKDDEDIVFEIIKIFHLDKFNCVSDRLKSNKEFVLKILKHPMIGTYEYNIVKYLSKSLRDDEDIILESSKILEKSYKYASDRLKRDKNFVSKLLKHLYCSDILIFPFCIRDDEHLASLFIKTNLENIYYISDRLKSDKKFILELDPEYLSGVVLDKFKNDKEVVMHVFEYDSSEFNSLSDELQDDYDVAIIAVEHDKYDLNYVSDRLRNDKSFMEKYYKFHPDQK
jgi:hypothetical protein